MVNCKFCEKDFNPINKNQKFCCEKCRRAVRVSCAQCGETVERLKNKSGIYFCSRLCSGKFYGRTVEKECNQCGLCFPVKKSSVERNWGKYCSVKCHNDSMKIVNYETCPCCKKKFKTGNNEIDKRKYCSRKCASLSLRKPIDKQRLYDLYVTQDLTAREVGHILNRDKKIVLDYLKFYDFPVKKEGFNNSGFLLCNDGHLVRSHYEKAFDNYLNKLGIKHEYEVRLPFDKRYACDFKINDVYVEIWGMMNWEKYRKSRVKKLDMYKSNSCKLLEVFPEDFKNLEIKINELKHLIT